LIVVDTSALLAILLKEEHGSSCLEALKTAENLAISAGTLTEAAILAAHKNLQPELEALLAAADVEVVPVTALTAQQCAEAHLQWGKGVHPAALNFGDCFSYQLAKSRNCALLFIGNDFSRTDIVGAL
jgi:ribonuclease VapC